MTSHEVLWIRVDSRLPDDGVVVDTKVDDEHGVRNETKRVRLGGLWWLPDGSMYVYYLPTHWRPVDGRGPR
jgi:hypothetical protein